MIPDGFPNWLTGPMTWKGKDYNQTPKEYVCLLDQDHLSVIENALRHFKGKPFFFKDWLSNAEKHKNLNTKKKRAQSLDSVVDSLVQKLFPCLQG